MAMVPKTVQIWWLHSAYCGQPYKWQGKTIEIKNINQELFESLFVSTDFFWAFYLNPNICHGNTIHGNYWNKILKLFGAILQ